MVFVLILVLVRKGTDWNEANVRSFGENREKTTTTSKEGIGEEGGGVHC